MFASRCWQVGESQTWRLGQVGLISIARLCSTAARSRNLLITLKPNDMVLCLNCRCSISLALHDLNCFRCLPELGYIPSKCDSTHCPMTIAIQRAQGSQIHHGTAAARPIVSIEPKPLGHPGTTSKQNSQRRRVLVPRHMGG